MGKVNVCLKRSYVIVISAVAIISLLLLGLTLFSHGYLHKEDEIEEVLAGLHTMYAVSIISLVLAIIGALGAYKEKQWALIVFTVGMILSSLFMFAVEIVGLASQKMFAEELKSQYLNALPLANASESFIHVLKDVQMEFQCCGLDQGFLDWNSNIPESCWCTEESTNPCVAAPRDSSLFKDSVGDEPVMIYGKACLPYIIMHEISVMNVYLGIMLGTTLLWVLSVVLCVVILCRLNRKEEVPTVVYSAQAKAGNYASLTEAADET